MRRKFKQVAPTEYDSPGDAVRLSEFGQAVSEAGADFVRVAFGCVILAVSAVVVLILAGKEPRDYARGVAFVASIPLLFLAGAVLLRSMLPFLNAIAEIISGRDLDESGAIGDIPECDSLPLPPPPEERIITIRPRNVPPPTQRLPVAFEDFVRGCEHDTTAARWEPVVGRHRYNAWRDALIENGWAAWKGESRRHGWQLMVPAEEILDACREFDGLARKFLED
ncbi:MAG: hypothetical protein D6800_03090 [Candidatus Zixiibacteriota bacterium]|nr:MAG: hypothetical protein D6800_03090 [candidate division Zixibacteria bacterium]